MSKNYRKYVPEESPMEGESELSISAPMKRYLQDEPSRQIDKTGQTRKSKQKVDMKYLIRALIKYGASDLHLASGQPPALRIRGEIERVKYKVLDDDDLRAMLYEIAPEQKIKVFEETGDIDFGYEIPGLARYRANFFMQKNHFPIGPL